jgi:peptidoglycan-N-acetylglucosamine deacetylase
MFNMKTTNIMSVDLEDYFCDLPFEQWSKYQSKIETSTELLLELFEKHNVKATFFTVGYIAEKFPKLIKKIHDIGHELGSHTYAHIDLRRVSRIEFEKDLLKSINVIEKNSGQKILGFRAPFFSINSENFWVFDILRKYFKYDSSIFPIRSPLYGMPKAPRTILSITREPNRE